MRMHLLTAITGVALLATPLAATAQTAPAAGTQAGLRIEANQIRAKQLMDRDVYTTDNTEVGEVEDLVIDPANGRIVSVVIEVENRLGLTDKYVAVDLNQLRLTPGERRITIDMTRDNVRSLRGITYND
ncbi:PRC-barrel domain-containing protein [Roseomonas sp. USHLN139]|uniref:PRC-barrel domain-containing protein n=1 Tax=Roseomonas sp. USHLN139 TaxID=3081298 RepID=UPI003B028C4B